MRNLRTRLSLQKQRSHGGVTEVTDPSALREYRLRRLLFSLHGRHTKRNPFFGQFRLVHCANLGRLIFMLEHVTAFGLADDRHPGMADLAQTSAQREMARRFLAGNEVMMKPALGRYEETPAMP